MIIEIGDARRVERLISLVEPLLDRKHWISNEALQTRRWCRILQTEESVCEWLPQIKNYIERKGNEHLISLAIGEWIGVPAQEAMRQGVCVAAEFSADEVGLSEVNFKYEPGDYAVFDEAMSFIIVCEKPDLAAIAGPESVLEELVAEMSARNPCSCLHYFIYFEVSSSGPLFTSLCDAVLLIDERP